MPTLYHNYEEESYQRLQKLIACHAQNLPHAVFLNFAKKIYKRNKWEWDGGRKHCQVHQAASLFDFYHDAPSDSQQHDGSRFVNAAVVCRYLVVNVIRRLFCSILHIYWSRCIMCSVSSPLNSHGYKTDTEMVNNRNSFNFRFINWLGTKGCRTDLTAGVQRTEGQTSSAF